MALGSPSMTGYFTGTVCTVQRIMHCGWFHVPREDAQSCKNTQFVCPGVNCEVTSGQGYSVGAAQSGTWDLVQSIKLTAYSPTERCTCLPLVFKITQESLSYFYCTKLICILLCYTFYCWQRGNICILPKWPGDREKICYPLRQSNASSHELPT